MTQTENYKELKKLFLVSVINYFKISCSSQSSCYPNLQGFFTSSPMIISHLLLLLIEVDIHLDPMYEKGTSWSSPQYWPKVLSSLESVISQIFVDHLPHTSYLPGDWKVRVPCTHEADILAREMETRNKGNGQFAIKAWECEEDAAIEKRMSEEWVHRHKRSLTEVSERLLPKGATVYSTGSSTPALLLWKNTGLLPSTNNILAYATNSNFLEWTLHQINVLSSVLLFVPAYFISGRFSPHIGCKIQVQGKPSVRLRLAVALLTERVKPDLKVKIKVEHLFKKKYLFLIEG